MYFCKEFLIEMTDIEAIKIRKSVRKYEKRELSPEIIKEIIHLIQNPCKGPFGNEPRFIFIEKPVAKAKEKVRLGTYGFISNASYFIGGCVEKFEFSEVDYGYCLEKIIIRLTSMGIGTCWIGGTFNRKDYAKLLDLKPNETIPAITPVGYKAADKTLREKLGLTFTDGSKRYNFETLFFEESLNNPLIFDPDDPYHQALECVRLAPSAVNKQPWRVIKVGSKYHFYLKREKITGAPKSTDLQKIDMGIALSHFKMALNELNIRGKWHIHNPNLCDLEYIISWIDEIHFMQ